MQHLVLVLPNQVRSNMFSWTSILRYLEDHVARISLFERHITLGPQALDITNKDYLLWHSTICGSAWVAFFHLFLWCWWYFTNSAISSGYYCLLYNA